MSKILGKSIVICLSVYMYVYSSNLASVAALKGSPSLESKAVNSISPLAIAAIPSEDCQEVGSSNRQPELAKKIVRYMRSKGYKVSTGEKEYNIIYLEGSCANGVPNADEPDYFNDRRILLEFVNGKPIITNNWSATSKPGQYYTDNPPNGHPGAARIAFNQYKNVWRVGIHRGISSKVQHEGLIQDGNVTISRNIKKNGKSDSGDLIQTGNFGLNQHGADGNPAKIIGRWSAGSLVGWSMQEHQKFMGILKGDARYQRNRNYHFTTTVINGDELALKESIDSEPVSEPATSEPATSDGE
jgi:hypothetical protein